MGFGQNVYTVHENEEVISIILFSYISITSEDEVVVNFTTESDSAIEGITAFISMHQLLSKTSYCVYDSNL